MARRIEAIINAAPGHQAIAHVKAVFIRRKGDYGFGWPGAVYDGEAALRDYTKQIQEMSEELRLDTEIISQPIYDNEASNSFINQLSVERPDGVLVVLLDRQQHAWPTANRAIETGVPTVVFAPIGAAFTTNVREPAKEAGAYVISSMNFGAVKYGLKMIKAHKQMRESKLVILKGDQVSEKEVENLGTKLKVLPLETFGAEYDNVGLPTARKEKEETEEGLPFYLRNR